MNITNIRGFDNVTVMYADAGITRINLIEVYSSICYGFETQLIRLLFFITLFLFIQRIMIPPVWEMFRNYQNKKFSELIDNVFRIYYDIIDTVILLCFIYIIVLLNISGVPSPYNYLFKGLFIFMSFTALIYFIGWLKSGGLKKFIKERRENLNKFYTMLKNNEDDKYNED